MNDIKNSLAEIQDADFVLDQILDKAKPFLKSSLKKWMDEQHSQTEKKVNNLFKLTFDEFMKLSSEDQKNWRHRILISKRDWLNKQLIRNNAEWLLILGGRIERISPTLDNFPSKNDVYQLAKDKNFAPFIYVKDPQIEESTNLKNKSNWSLLNNRDFYPSIKIYIGLEDTSIEELINPKNEIITDFDTGSPVIVIDQGELKKRDIPVENEFEVANIHLGKTYDFPLPQINIGVKTSHNSHKSRSFRVRSVSDWKSSPFCIINPNRKGLVGRNLLIDLNLHILLKGDEKVTQIIQ